MAKEVKLPKVSMGQTEGSISEWLVEEGSWVEKDEMIMVMDTEKVSYDLESPETGFAVFQVALEEVVPCGTIVILMAESEDELQALLSKKNMATQEATQTIPQKTEDENPPTGLQAIENAVAQVEAPVITENQSSGAMELASRRIRITPVAKKKALVHNLDYSDIIGTGPNNRIKLCDVDNRLAQHTGQNNGALLQSVTNTLDHVKIPANTDIKCLKNIPFKGVRKAIADNVKFSQNLAAQTHFTGEVDMSELMAARKRLNTKIEHSGDKIGYNDLLIYIMARAIKKVPIVNSSLIDNEIKVWEDINIGLAVAIELNEYESGLYVPVIHNADKKSLLQISRETRAKIEKTKNGHLASEDTVNGTITLSPLGSIVSGYSTSTPIIQQPQAFIINSGAITERVVPINGEMQIRPIMTLSCTFDHRIMDGVPALKFFNTMKEIIEDFILSAL